MVGFQIGFGATQSLPRHKEMVPLGGIIQWSGAIVDIPTGWQLCDGSNNTPDLRGKFVRGAGPVDPVDELGGTNAHGHSFNDGGHTHARGAFMLASGSGSRIAWDADSPSSSTEAAGNTDVKDNRPNFWTLAYIQRMV